MPSKPPSRDAVTAMRRFGLGPRPADAAAIGDDPRGWLLDQLKRTPETASFDGLPPSHELFDDARAALARRREILGATPAEERRRQEVRTDAEAEPKERGRPSREAAAARPKDMAETAPARETEDRARRERLREAMGEAPRDTLILHYTRDVEARVHHATTTELPFVERLVWFWSNHFCVSIKKKRELPSIAGAYEREAIRTNIAGRFSDMLSAVVRHPAMLIYLDNIRSIGPNSRVGDRRERGLNENLAREILELHTLGVDGGYAQADVTAFAKVLTGWTVVLQPDDPDAGTFTFRASAHEPGAFTVLGKRYAEGGQEQGRAVLADLARHPATARHVARKLAAHFVSDRPPPALIDKLAHRFRDTGGDLTEIAAALVRADEAWAPEPTKVAPPNDLVIAAHRLTGSGDVKSYLATVTRLGQRPWEVPSPEGWPDGARDWAAGDALLERLDWASQLARRVAGTTNVVALATDTFGETLSSDTAQTVRRAESREQALALLLMSPEFQMR